MQLMEGKGGVVKGWGQAGVLMDGFDRTVLARLGGCRRQELGCCKHDRESGEGLDS